MDAELTGRKVKVSRELRTLAEQGLARIEKVVGSGANAHVILTREKHAEVAEVTVKARHHTVVGLAEAPELNVALKVALDKAEKQALRWKKSWQEKKRQGKSIRTVLQDGAAETETKPVARSKKVASNGKAFRAKRISGLHVVPAPELLADRWMTLEEAVKEAEAADHGVLVFRDLAGEVKVLHCPGDGIVRLIEVS